MFREKVLSELDEGPRLNLKFNRSKAALYMAHPERQDAEPLIEQLMKQVPKRAFKTLKRDSVPWHVELIGEGATDAGGPARDIFSQMCIEVMNPITGLFIETPNRRNNIGENQEVLIPNSYAISEEMQQRFVYVGLLMTIAFISRLQQPFKLAEFVWAYLTGEPLTIEDIYAVDNAFERLMKEIDNNEINDEEAKRRGLTFTAIDSHGAEVDLFPGGSSVKVTQEKLTEYSQLYKKYRLDEMKLQLDRLKEGIRYFFPEEATSLLSPWELELLVCGDMKVSVDDLKKHCKYDAKDHSTQMLWEVLEGFSPEERMLFIKFATGRMGLPPPGMKWHSELSIVWVQAHAIDDQQMPLPTAATCSSSIRIPRYSTKEWMARKIRAAILFGTEIDTDRQVDFSQIAPLS
ncbi:putative E3 ubiquitin-protein ligase HERC1 [Histomonas meleagridis]|uniref:putative E3 ubiquitin-protein ligase HERC1 n=1 Tax=Histomonas meleagridis TaxID=135588 RepID=UPI00355A1856|nr:putative E3 ubiquitin-protein ligase HERC1 [Histomonas meleagridis]KAH0805146.1 putative E3 ubiquitin-protein ligase HERC1 [Histomonas meleagridis]